MKKQLKEELIALAEKVMLLKQQEEINSSELKALARQLYEKLVVISFTEDNLSGLEGPMEADPVKNQDKLSEESGQEVEEEEDEYAPNGLQYNDSEAITEPNTEKIKDIVAQMPPETQKLDEMLEHILPRKYQKNDMEDVGGVHYDQLPSFEPVDNRSQESEKPRSLNDRLKKSIHIGVNDRHAFIKHLFEGSTADYNRVLSQLNTIKSKEEALNFVLKMVKPDYNNWEGKEDCEVRFLAIVENKFD